MPSSTRGILGREMEQKRMHFVLTGFQLAAIPRLCSEPHGSSAVRGQRDGEVRAGWGEPRSPPLWLCTRLALLASWVSCGVLLLHPNPCRCVRRGGSQQAKCVSVHSGFTKRSSHVSWAPRLQLTLPLLGWVFQRILINNWWLRGSFGKPVCPFPL